MRPLVVPVLLLSLWLLSLPAYAWEPENDPGSEPEPKPAAEPSAPSAEPSAVEPPDGIYLVTDTYSGDLVTRSGPVTTFETATIHETTGSYAGVLETVGTGGSSTFDGAAFNGRATLTDGRAVAGTYYENYVRTNDGFVAVSIVFFQDDSEIARATARVAPIVESGPLPTNERAPVVIIAPGAGGDDGPIVDREPPSLTPSPLPDRVIEVLRGRRIALWFTDPSIRGWRYISGEATALGPLRGAAADPFRARWDRLAPAGQSWAVRFLIDFTDGRTRELAVRVTVRAPGLVE